MSIDRPVSPPRVLVIASTRSYRAGAFLDAAHRVGAAVTVGSDCAQALAGFHPAGHLVLDFDQPDTSAARIAEFAARNPIEAVVAADDEGVELAAIAAARLGLRFHPVEAVRLARNKLRMREALAAAGLPGPRFRPLAPADDPAAIAGAVRYPCVVKPLSLGASRGVMRADDPASFVAACHRARRIASAAKSGTTLLVEDFVPGAEVAVEGLVTAGRLRILAVFDKCDPLDGPTFEETIYVTPSRHPESVRSAIAATAQRVVEALGLVNGPVHAEFRLPPGDCWPLEIAPRPIGGLCSRSLRFGAGATLEELILRHALELDAEDTREPAASGVMMIPIPRAGVLLAVRGQEQASEVPGITEVRVSLPLGDEVVPLPEGSRYLGFLFARGESPAAVEQALREAHRRLEFDIMPRASGGEPATAAHAL